MEGEAASWFDRPLEGTHLIVQPQRYWQPHHGLRPQTEGEDWEWESLDEDPQFLLRRHLPLPGWHMVELDLDHDQSSVSVRLYFDTGKGFSEDQSLALPLKGGRITKRLIYVEGWLKRLRFDPMETPGRFAIRHFRIVWLTPWFAHDRLSQRLVNMHHRWRDVSKREVIGVLKRRARQEKCTWRQLALSDYEETFERFCSGRSYEQWLRERGWEDNLPSRSEGAGELRLSTLEPGWRARDRRAELDEIRRGLDGWRGKDERRRSLALQRRSAANGGVESGVVTVEEAMSCTFKPLVSILLPVHDPAPEHLKDCLESVLSQDYDHWQLCIVDDASRNHEVIALLEQFEALDSRITLRRQANNGHICEASNTALSMAAGPYVALLDHDDLLAPCALSYVSEALNRSPRPVLVYSDEDKVDQRGVRCEPHFKPCFNPDLLLSQNYMAHLSVFDTALVRQLGGFRKGLEGSQDHDLALRVCAHTEPDRIVHIPRILYHWRASPDSTAMTSNAKQYTSRAGLRAVADHLARNSPGATVELGRLPNTYRVRWPLPNPLPLVSLMIPTRDRVDLLAPCVDAILSRTRYSRLEVLILDNGTRCEETLAYLAEIGKGDPRVRILAWNHRFNYSGINNFGAYHARGDVLGLINNDIEPINEEWLEEMVRHAVRPDIGCVGAKLYYPNDTIQHAGVVLGIGGVAGHAHKYFSRHANGYFSRLVLTQNYSAVTGACLLIRKALYRQVGGLNARDLPIAFNDVDLCLKVREAGYRNVWTPDAELYHHESESRGADDNASKRARAIGEVLYMRHTWGEQLDRDPAYNPNLTLVHEDFSLR
ncbi:glycosyltransferase [Halomonas sp. DN3]|uniref:glycosyltransferase family 2 protein n=1 Tax=Halomonas sp. DN3 TaxID=2953657 RepID=UPI00209E875F|nr:glycosyltransferase family 2 protein [Halomonas sp. DN3]USZ49660.1 glycosyltransferase family 2 protein [Halomonas sp. DN3]